MKKLLLAVALTLAIFLVACGPPEQNAANGGSSDSSAPAEEAAATPTQVVLATPTPKPAPPTPTPRPAPTIAQIESAAESEAEAESTDEAGAAETEAASGPLFEDMILIPAGPFTMGQDNSKPKNGPAHEVDLPAYEIDHFEVTNDEFALFTEQSGYVTYAEQNSNKDWRDAAQGKGNHPVVYVTWDDATAYCEWAGKRLPTEAEWEKAARGDDGRVFPWGNEFVAENGNFYEGGIRGTTAVGSFAAGASPFGVEDMAGNVREWTADYFVAYPGQAADADAFFGEENRVNRGGGWFDGEDGELVTTYNRNAGPPGTSANDDIGFRCARDAEG
ncbi:MAG: formylglycine-generating enzyme family protein [Anaerolineae bacterium]|nr:formylglycine-generating enzyme family protein [Anaerolineae bacterium]